MIEVQKLVKDFGPIRAVDGISFQVERGEILGFLGPNGAGKSTTMKMLTCFLPPSSGTAVVGGCDILERPLEVRRQIGYLPEGTPLYGDLGVESFLRFIAEVRGIRRRDRRVRVEEVIRTCHLAGVRHQSIETLSKGFRQRVGFAQAILHDPPILVLDEPTDGLDPNQKHEVRLLIRSMAENKCIVLSTHILEEVEAVCTRAVIIDRGRIVADDAPDALRRRSRKHGALRLVLESEASDELVRGLSELEGVGEVRSAEASEAGTAVVELYPAAGSLAVQPVLEWVLGRGCKVRELNQLQGSLDEVFRSITRGEGVAA